MPGLVPSHVFSFTHQVSVLPRRLSSGVVRILRRGGGLGRVHIPDLLKWIARPCPISHGYTPVSCALAGLLTRRARGPQELRPQWTKTSRTSSIFVNFGTLRNLVCLTPGAHVRPPRADPLRVGLGSRASVRVLPPRVPRRSKGEPIPTRTRAPSAPPTTRANLKPRIDSRELARAHRRRWRGPRTRAEAEGRG